MIRKIEKSDIPECVEVIKEAFMSVADEFGFTKDNAPKFTAFVISKEKLIQQYGDRRLMYAYHDGSRIAGFYSLKLSENGECELNNLSVLPAYRHKGIGGELLFHAFDEARKQDCRTMKIGIVEENTLLRKWYEAHGFVHTGTKKFEFFPFTCGYMEKELH